MKGLKKILAVSLILGLTMGEFGGGLSVTARAAENSDEIIITDSMEDNIGDENYEQETSEDISIEDVVIEDEDTSLDIAEEDVIVDESEEDALEDASFDASSVDDPESGTSFDTLSEKEKNNSNIDYIKNGVTYYKLWVGDTQVSSDNRKKIPSITFGSASFEPSTNTLYCSTVQNIRGTYTPSGYSVPCVIYAEIPLTISGYASFSCGNENVMGIAVRKTNLSIKGTLGINDAKYGIYVDNGNVNLGSDDGNTSVYIRNTTYALMGRGGEINFGPGDYGFQGTYGIKAEGSNINFNQGRVTANGEKYAIASRWEDKFIFGEKLCLWSPLAARMI